MTGLRATVLLLCVLGGSADNPWDSLYRLPSTVSPAHYDLHLHPDLATNLFTGQAKIYFNSTEEQPFFAIHSKGLNITEPSLQVAIAGGFEDVTLSSTEYSPSNELYVLVPGSPLPAGDYVFECRFSGSLAANGLVGFYHSDYVTAEGDKRALATTKFEPTYARMAFPSFDEPSFKATFAVTVVKPKAKEYIVLGNMPVQSTVEDSPSDGLTTVSFQKSVPMVTYLVCFIVCDFQYIEAPEASLPFRVYAPKDRLARAQYALDSGVSILEYYEDMFDLAFPLPKSDMAAIPDYVSGATEHWGIITYRETSVLYDPLTNSEANKQRVASVVAHELAHQWFGNLVTLEWWDDLWLNEGFASYIEGKGVAHIEPEWDMDVQFLSESLHHALNIDAGLSSHPIVQQVESPDQITAMFDSISYDKGASVLRMLEGFLGTPVFEAGVNAFLKRFAYDNAVTADLWAELTAQWNKDVYMGDVATIMGTWTEQMGYPLLTAQLTAGQLAVSQRRFLQDPTATSDPSLSPHGYQWMVPLTVVSSDSEQVSAADQTTTTGWLNSTSTSLALPPTTSWYKLNPGQVGYFRVNYEAENWAKLTSAVAQKTLPPADRANLVDDALALSDAEILGVSTALDLTKALSEETHLVPWLVAADRLPRMMYLLQDTEVYAPMQQFIQDVTEFSYNRLGWEDEVGGSHLDGMLRPNLVYLSCISGLGSCLEEAANLLTAYAEDTTTKLPLSTTRQVYRQGMVKGGTNKVWNTLWELCVATQDATQKTNLLYGLANSQNRTTLLRYIKMSQNTDNVRSQDFLNVLIYISDNPVGTPIVWDWVRLEWDWLVDRYTLNDRYLGNLIPSITKYFATEERLQEMEAFFEANPEAGAGEAARQQALETVKTNIRWRAVVGPQIAEYLNN